MDYLIIWFLHILILQIVVILKLLLLIQGTLQLLLLLYLSHIKAILILQKRPLNALILRVNALSIGIRLNRIEIILQIRRKLIQIQKTTICL